MKRLLPFGFVLFPLLLLAQEHGRHYTAPSDPLVQKNLAEWQDLKFGLLMHWGTYSQWGIVETSFNPTRFNPEKWAAAAQNAGMRYVVFTTKHHDGFCMFDTHQTDYKITDSLCPFSSNPRADVTKAIFEAFREQKFKVGAYFSKPDWHSPNFWWPYFPPKDRNINYDLNRYPQRYQHFRDFTYNQLEELCTNYGHLDLLWLDGAWVRPDSTINRKESWQSGIPDGQDLEMHRIAAMAREKQPGIMIVDRWIPGPYENYLTPEQGVPDKPLGVPWETCMTMGNSWSYVPKENYKSPRRLIHTLCDVVSKGGNLLLNIAPGPDGAWHPEAYQRLEAIGKWMDVNSEAIYGTHSPRSRITRLGNMVYTEKGENLYAIYLAEEGEEQLPDQVCLRFLCPGKDRKITLLGCDTPLNWRCVDGDTVIWLPAGHCGELAGAYAWVFKIGS